MFVYTNNLLIYIVALFHLSNGNQAILQTIHSQTASLNKRSPQNEDQSIQPRIFLGHDAQPGEVPWHIQIRLDGEIRCNGCLTKHAGRQFVLTTGECGTVPYGPSCYSYCEPIPANKRDLQVRAGRLTDDGPDPDGHEQIRKVVHVERHPDFMDYKPIHKNDIAIFFLEQPFEENEFVQAVELPAIAEKYPWGHVFKVSGWGQVNDGSAPSVRKLQVGEYLIFAWATCNEIYKNTAWYGISRTQMCTMNVTTGEDVVPGGPCKNDIGGPAVSKDSFEDFWFVSGLFSRVENPCGGLIPPVYEAVSWHKVWIEKNYPYEL